MTARLPPPYAILTRFLRERHPQSVAQVAELLQWPEGQVIGVAEELDALTADGLVRWDEAAAWLLERWPLAVLLNALGEEATLLPLALHPIPLTLQLPAYLVHALQVQSRIEAMPHRIAPPANDVEFMRAWDFPRDGNDDDA